MDVDIRRDPHGGTFGRPDRHGGAAGARGEGSAPTSSRRRHRCEIEIARGGDLRVVVRPLRRRSTRVTSDLGVHAERLRIAARLRPEAGPSRPNPACADRGRGVPAPPGGCRGNGTSAHGARRFMCRERGGATSPPRRPVARRKRSHANRTALALVANGMAMRRIATSIGVERKTLCDGIAFPPGQCLRFARHRERTPTEMEPPRLLPCSDERDRRTNRTDRARRRNTRPTSVGAADPRSGRVFGMTLNRIDDLDVRRLEAETRARGELSRPAPCRRRGRFRRPDDMEGARGPPGGCDRERERRGPGRRGGGGRRAPGTGEG